MLMIYSGQCLSRWQRVEVAYRQNSHSSLVLEVPGGEEVTKQMCSAIYWAVECLVDQVFGFLLVRWVQEERLSTTRMEAVLRGDLREIAKTQIKL